MGGGGGESCRVLTKLKSWLKYNMCVTLIETVPSHMRKNA